jgi:DNA-binding NtrC family response regulator
MRHREPNPPFTVAVASRDRVWVDSLSSSLHRHGLRVRGLALTGAPGGAALAGVDVLLLDTDSLTAEDLAQASALRRSVPLVEVVALAGDSPVADAVRALRDGVFTVLQHPVADGLLLESLVAAGRRHRHAQARFEELDGTGVAASHRRRRKAPVAAGPGRKDGR